jgi:MFS family permease
MLYTPSFLAMALANLFTVSSFGTFFLFPIFIKDHGGSNADIGIIMGTLSLSSVLCRPWISEMIDRIGRKRSYTIGSLIMSLIPLSYLNFNGDLYDFYYLLIIVRVFHGIGLAICFTSAFTYVADIVPEGRLNEGVGMFGISGLVGMAIGPVIGEIVIRSSGFPLFFITSSGIATLGLIAHLPLAESHSEGIKNKQSPSFFSVLNKKRISIVVIISFLFGFGLAATGGFVTPYAEEKNCPLISLYYISYSISAIITRLLGGKLADRIGENKIIPYALIITGTGIFIMVFLGGSSILVISGLMTGCGHGLLFPSLNVLAVRNEPKSIRGKITGLFTGGIDGGAFSGSIILGYIGELSGYQAIFIIAGLSFFLAFKIFRSRDKFICGNAKSFKYQ